MMNRTLCTANALLAYGLILYVSHAADNTPPRGGKADPAPHTAASPLSLHPYEGFTQPVRVIEVAAGDTGRVASVLVRDGDHVEQGQQILELESTVLDAQRSIALEDAKSTAKLNSLTVEHELKARRLEQFRQLLDAGKGSAEEMARAEADERIALYSLQQAQEEQRKFQLRVEEIEARIAARQVTAPIGGIVTEVKREIGESVSAADPVVATLVDLSRLRAVFYLPASEAFTLSADQTVTLRFVDTGRKGQGTVELVSPIIEADSGRVLVQILIDNQDGRLRSGMRSLLTLQPDQHQPGDPRTANQYAFPNASSTKPLN